MKYLILLLSLASAEALANEITAVTPGPGYNTVEPPAGQPGCWNDAQTGQLIGCHMVFLPTHYSGQDPMKDNNGITPSANFGRTSTFINNSHAE